MQFWWVNQNQTYQHEVRGGYLWSPKTNANGNTNPFYDNMTKVTVGDIVFSFKDTLIPAIGTNCSVKSEGVQTTQTRHSYMNLGFSEPDIRGE